MGGGTDTVGGGVSVEGIHSIFVGLGLRHRDSFSPEMGAETGCVHRCRWIWC